MDSIKTQGNGNSTSNGSDILVIKIGGSCLKNGKTLKEAIKKVKSVTEQQYRIVIVVSALHGMTDSLLELAENAHEECDAKSADKLLAEGEQLSVKVMSSALNSIGLKTEQILVWDSNFPIITNSDHGNASIEMDETTQLLRERLLPILNEGIIPVVPGFVGKTIDGHITTLGRGGSDTTAVVVGNALSAKEVILLKDVEGILSANPSQIPSAEKINTMSVEECWDLGVRGGEVLCPISLLHKPADMPVRVVGFNNGDILTTGTLIVGELKDEIKINVSNGEKAAITVIGDKMSNKKGLLTRFSAALSEAGVNIDSLSASTYSICFYVNVEDEQKALKALHDLVIASKDLTAVSSIKNISMITVAGRGFAIKPGVVGRIGMSLAKEGINIIDMNTSACEATVLVDMKDADKAKQVLEMSL